MLTCTIYAVMVWMLSKKFKVIFGVAPAARVTAIVSPTALDMARMKEARMPESAAGTTIFVDTSNFVEPRAYAPSLRARGTERMASSLKLETIGRIMMPTTMDAEAALNMFAAGTISRSRGVMKLIAK